MSATAARGDELLRTVVPAHERARLSLLTEQQPLDAALKALGITKLGQRLAIAAAIRAAGTNDDTDDLVLEANDDDAHVDVFDGGNPTLEVNETPTKATAHPPTKKSEDGTLTEAQCLSLLAELLIAYREPSFLAKLRTLQQTASPGVYLQQLGGLVLNVQVPVFRRWGLPPNASGVELMKQAIHRRIAEGRPEAQRQLEGLVNEARATLGLAPLPDTRTKGTAEDLMASMLGTDDDAAALSVSTRARLESSSREGRVSVAASAYLREQLREGVQPLFVRSLLSMAEVGLPLDCLSGRDAGPFNQVPIWMRQPSAEEFFAEHVLPSRPAVLRGLVTPEGWAPMRDFRDFDYLRRRCGHRKVLVKSLAVDDTHGRPVFVSDPELRLPLLAFLDAVEHAETHGARCPFYLGKVALRQELPELDDDLRTAGASPIDALASCFGALQPHGLFTYFGCDRNVTATHFDPSENMMLCLYGTKRLWLYPPSDVHHLYPVAKKDGSRSAAPPFQRYEELPERLRATFPETAHARPIEVNLVAGDILYLPACWWHCVEGSRERNMIVNWWHALHPHKRMHDAGGAGSQNV